MSDRTVRYTKGEVGRVKVVRDFLPSPEKLVLADDTTQVTLSLTRRSVDFFKDEAKRQRVPYQRMIRVLVDEYAAAHRRGRRK